MCRRWLSSSPFAAAVLSDPDPNLLLSQAGDLFEQLMLPPLSLSTNSS